MKYANGLGSEVGKTERRKDRKDKKPLHTFGLNGRSNFRTFILSLPNEFS